MAVSDKLKLLPTQIVALRRKYNRTVSHDRTAVGSDALPVNPKEFWMQYADYAVKAVALSLDRARCSLEYMDTMIAHPGYRFDHFAHRADPEKSLMDFAMAQEAWINAMLNHSLFFAVRADKKKEANIALLREGFTHFKADLDDIVPGHVQRLAKTGGLPGGLYQDNTRKETEDTIHQRADNIMNRFCLTGLAQVYNRVVIADKVLDVLAAGQTMEFAFLDRPLDLSQAYLEDSLQRIDHHFNQTTLLRATEIAYDFEDRPIFPIIRTLPLDCSL